MARTRGRFGGGSVAAAALALLLGIAAPALAVAAPHRVVRREVRPCDILARSGTPCVAAYSSTRALLARYDGPLYMVKRASDGKTKNIGLTRRGGFADAAEQSRFCAHTSCVVEEIFDQTSDHNTLVPQPTTTAPYSNTLFPHNPVSASALPILIGGHRVYGLKFEDDSPTGLPCETAGTCLGNQGEAYDNGHRRGQGIATGDEPEGTYGVFGGTYSGNDCCFDFGNSEIPGTDDGNGHMDALNFSRACWDGCGAGGGPWVEADIENGMYMSDETTTNSGEEGYIGGSFETGHGFCCAGTSRNLALAYPFATGFLVNNGQNRWAIRGGDAQRPALSTFYSGPYPPGYGPMHLEGAIILGSGGDQGTTDGEFFEGAMTRGIPSLAAQRAVQRNIADADYRALPAESG